MSPGAEPRVLKDDADLAADLLDVERLQLSAVVGDGPLGRRLEPEQEPQQGRLAGTRRADHGDELTGPDLEVHRVEDQGPVGRVPERDIVQPDGAPQSDQLAADLVDLRRGGEDRGESLALPQAVDQGDGPLAQADHGRQLPASARH